MNFWANKAYDPALWSESKNKKKTESGGNKTNLKIGFVLCVE